MNQDQQARWDEAIKGIAENTLTEVDLSSCGLRNEEEAERNEKIRQLAAALETNTTLKTLKLSYNNIGDVGARLLADALLNNTALTNLNLFNNNIGPNGTKDIAGALEKNTTLTNLNLSSNNIGVDGAKYLAGALLKNTVLEILDLGINNIRDNGAKALADALETNTVLTNLNLWDNNIGAEGAEHLIKLLERNPFLQQLNCRANSASEEQLSQIENLLIENILMVPKIADKIIDAGWEVVPQGENPKGKGVKLTAEEMEFINNPRNDAKVARYIEKITAEKITEEKQVAENQISAEAKTAENLVVKTTTFASRLAEAMKENPNLSIPHPALSAYLNLFSAPEGSTKEVMGLANQFDFIKFLQVLLGAENGSDVRFLEKKADDLAKSLPTEVVGIIAKYLGPHSIIHNSEKRLLLKNPPLRQTAAAAPKDGASIANSSTTNSSETRQPEANQPMARQPGTRTEAPSPSIISRYFCNCLSGIFNRRNNGAQNPPSGRGNS